VRYRLAAAEVAALRNALAAALEHLRAGLEMLPLVPADERQRAEADLLASSVAMSLLVEGRGMPRSRSGAGQLPAHGTASELPYFLILYRTRRASQG
jgi:hypothetical protein